MIDGSTLILILALLVGGVGLLFWLGEKVNRSAQRNEMDNHRHRHRHLHLPDEVDHESNRPLDEQPPR